MIEIFKALVRYGSELRETPGSVCAHCKSSIAHSEAIAPGLNGQHATWCPIYQAPRALVAAEKMLSERLSA
jgi:hypothetical protein